MTNSAPTTSSKTVDHRAQLELALGQPFVDGNTINDLQNGDEIFPVMLDAIRAARVCVDFMTFVYWQGSIAKEFATALSNRARAGVTVRVLLDAYGARRINNELVSEMEAAGVELRWFRPLSTWRIWRSDKRTHRKVLVCDHRIGFIGGVGIADEWRGQARDASEWRDCHFEIQGQAVRGLRAAFLDNWNEAGDWTNDLACQAFDVVDGNVPMQVVRASTTIGWTDIATLVRTLIQIAERRLIVVTAYFAPDEKMVKMICEAVKRGVDVDVLTAGKHTDSRLSQLAGQRHYAALLECGVTIRQYQRTMLHSKLILVDDDVCCLGSANINHRSLSKDEECCVVALSTDLNATLTADYERDCEHAKTLNLCDWQVRSWWQCQQERLAGLLVEQL
ncbi:cardiolipin synthase B [Arenicella chitinivorans]|uniref:Cardiolipin synthase B n=1 Tax=Arenicella chitinivorans TaxID=1329800 RepID=A0A918VQF1_9GAMM|nr:phospholipase D-like domain-containing protein [Arenicella chitinivorans]GHA19328.1 cardiolipin synthase B [Arenicella chitinivorans]